MYSIALYIIGLDLIATFRRLFNIKSGGIQTQLTGRRKENDLKILAK